MKKTTTKTLYTYWNEVRGGRAAPHRFEIEPARIAGILPETFILERADDRTYLFRLAGTRICQYFGREFRGTNFLEGWTAPDRITLERQLSTISKQNAVGFFEFEAVGLDDRAVDFELLLLPLAQYNGRVDRFLGSISVLEERDWLGSTRLVRKQLLSHELQWPNGRPTPSFHSAQSQPHLMTNVRHARIVKTERTQLRVYDGGLANEDTSKV